ncbi:MAG: DNA alkylation repair protein [Promethearchaeota archaeon]
MIKSRSVEFFEKNINVFSMSGRELDVICQLITVEYKMIPGKERVGKGMVYIVKAVAKAFVDFLGGKVKGRKKKVELIMDIIQVKPTDKKALMFVIFLASHVATEDFKLVKDFIIEWAQSKDWEIREMACYPVISGLKKQAEETFAFLNANVNSSNEYIRRLCAESLRPKAELKWLRDPEDARNNLALLLLTHLNHDPSIYVRKAVGNNLKDLSKYMPRKILEVMAEWLDTGKSLGARERKYLLWIVYQGLRWLKEKEPKYHHAIEKLVGRNYLLYFNEKSNRWAVPRVAGKKE